MERGKNENNENIIKIHCGIEDDNCYCNRQAKEEHVQNNEHPFIFDNVTLQPIICNVEGDFKHVEKYCLLVSQNYP